MVLDGLKELTRERFVIKRARKNRILLKTVIFTTHNDHYGLEIADTLLTMKLQESGQLEIHKLEGNDITKDVLHNIDEEYLERDEFEYDWMGSAHDLPTYDDPNWNK